MLNKKSWVGYSASAGRDIPAPRLKAGVYPISIAYPESINDNELKERLNLAYAAITGLGTISAYFGRQ
ncbi:MAG: hypothetical protein HC905_19580 [Bacteroidales bacterium]|nr:hypothetical protein [Bacteroidales bacterium]